MNVNKSSFISIKIIGKLVSRLTDICKIRHKTDITVTNHYLDEENECFVMQITGSNIDYDGIYARRENGAIIYPIDSDRSGTVRFRFEKGTLNIYIPDTEGGIVQAVLSK